MIKSSEDLLGRVSGFISFRDNTNRNLLKDIRQGLKKYIQQPNDRDKAAESVVKAVDTLTYNIMHNKVERFIKSLIIQLVAFQCYEDLILVFLFP